MRQHLLTSRHHQVKLPRQVSLCPCAPQFQEGGICFKQLAGCLAHRKKCSWSKEICCPSRSHQQPVLGCAGISCLSGHHPQAQQKLAPPETFRETEIQPLPHLTRPSGCSPATTLLQHKSYIPNQPQSPKPAVITAHEASQAGEEQRGTGQALKERC